MKLASALQSKTLQQTLQNIHGFVYNNFQYQSEGLKHDLQTLSRAWHEYRNKGINCEDATLITLQLLSALGIKAYARRIHQHQNPGVASHVYVIVPKNQQSGKILGRDSYWVVDGTLPVFNQEASFVKALDTYSAPAFKGLNGSQGLNFDPVTVGLYITLVATVIDIGFKLYDAELWDDKEAERLLNYIKGFRERNDFKLYPRKHEGGPWRNVGFGDLDMMTKEELRYFIEWRMPMWKKQMRHKDWGDTKKRVKQRYFAAQESIREEAILVYKNRFGCYKHSGLYDNLVIQSTGKSTLHPHSTEILTFDDNCQQNPEGSEGTGLFIGGPGDVGTSNLPSGEQPGQPSGSSEFADVDITTGQGGFVTFGSGENKITLPISAALPENSNNSNSFNKSSIGWLATAGIIGGLFYASRKSGKAKKKEVA